MDALGDEIPFDTLRIEFFWLLATSRIPCHEYQRLWCGIIKASNFICKCIRWREYFVLQHSWGDYSDQRRTSDYPERECYRARFNIVDNQRQLHISHFLHQRRSKFVNIWTYHRKRQSTIARLWLSAKLFWRRSLQRWQYNHKQLRHQ